MGSRVVKDWEEEEEDLIVLCVGDGWQRRYLEISVPLVFLPVITLGWYLLRSTWRCCLRETCSELRCGFRGCLREESCLEGLLEGRGVMTTKIIHLLEKSLIWSKTDG